MIDLTNSIGMHRVVLRSASVASALLIAACFTGEATARDTAATKVATEIVPETPLQMLVSLKEQQIKVYRGTELIRTAPISSGKRGNSTPTGVFSILEKRRKHFSNLYNNAPMPFMQRLTWSGIALHQGRLPGYPASHGCIRLPRNFAKDLYGMTERGMHVVVTRDAAVPSLVKHAILPQPVSPGTKVASLSSKTIAADPALRGTFATASLETDLTVQIPDNPHFDRPLRIIVTPGKVDSEARILQRLLNKMGFGAGTPDGVVGPRTRAAIRLYQEGADLPVTGNVTTSLTRHIHDAAGYEKPQNAILRVRRKFKDIYQAPVTLTSIDQKIGTHVFTALGFEQGAASVNWMAVPAEGEASGTPKEILDRLVMSDKVRDDLARILTPGTSLIVTDRSFARNTGLGTDFVVVTR